MSKLLSHDDNFKNMLLDFPEASLEVFFPQAQEACINRCQPRCFQNICILLTRMPMWRRRSSN